MTVSEMDFDTKLRRDFFRAGHVTAVAELMFPGVDDEMHIRLLRLVVQQCTEIRLELGPSENFSIGMVAEAIDALGQHDVGECPEVPRPT